MSLETGGLRGIGQCFWLHINTSVTIMRKEPLAPSCLEPEWPWPDQVRKWSAQYECFKFCVGISRQCPSGLGSSSPQDPRVPSLEGEGCVFELTAIFGNLDSCSMVSAPLGPSPPLLGGQEKEETGAWLAGLAGKFPTPPQSLHELGSCRCWPYPWLMLCMSLCCSLSTGCGP